MIKIRYIFVFLYFFSIITANAQFLSNPSFEGNGNDNEAPQGWTPCTPNCSPDNPPLPEIEIFLPASQGSRYLSMRTRGGESWNSYNQFINDDVCTRLLSPLIQGRNYKLKIDLANDTYVELWGTDIFTHPCRLRVWGATAECAQDELLGETEAVSDTTWKTFEFCFTPKDNSYNYFFLEADYVNNDSSSGMLLVDNLFIIENPDTNGIVVLDTIVMPGAIVNLHASEGSVYSWSPSTGLSCNSCQNPSVSINREMIYSVRIINDYTCIYNEKFILRLPDCNTISQIKSGVKVDTSIKLGESIMLYAGMGENYNWWPQSFLSCTNCPSTISTPSSAINYTCTFLDESDCSISYEYRIKFIIEVPNVITPNSDGYNDNFFINGLPPKSKLKIIDRAGREIYQTSDYVNNWPDCIGGSLIKQTDTYWYLLECPGMNPLQGYVLVKF